VVCFAPGVQVKEDPSAWQALWSRSKAGVVAVEKSRVKRFRGFEKTWLFSGQRSSVLFQRKGFGGGRLREDQGGLGPLEAEAGGEERASPG